MALPLIAMMVLGAVRLATPTVAKLLAKSGFKKVAKGSIKNASKITQKEAKTLAKKPSMIKGAVQHIKRDLKEDPTFRVELGSVVGLPPVVEGLKWYNKKEEKEEKPANKNKGGTVKNYANGGGVRKAKFMDN